MNKLFLLIIPILLMVSPVFAFNPSCDNYVVGGACYQNATEDVTLNYTTGDEYREGVLMQFPLLHGENYVGTLQTLRMRIFIDGNNSVGTVMLHCSNGRDDANQNPFWTESSNDSIFSDVFTHMQNYDYENIVGFGGNVFDLTDMIDGCYQNDSQQLTFFMELRDYRLNNDVPTTNEDIDSVILNVGRFQDGHMEYPAFNFSSSEDGSILKVLQITVTYALPPVNTPPYLVSSNLTFSENSCDVNLLVEWNDTEGDAISNTFTEGNFSGSFQNYTGSQEGYINRLDLTLASGFYVYRSYASDQYGLQGISDWQQVNYTCGENNVPLGVDFGLPLTLLIMLIGVVTALWLLGRSDSLLRFPCFFIGLLILLWWVQTLQIPPEASAISMVYYVLIGMYAIIGFWRILW